MKEQLSNTELADKLTKLAKLNKELKIAPVEDGKSLAERVEEAALDNYKGLILEIAALGDEVEKELLGKALSSRLKVNYSTIKREIKSHNPKKETSVEDNHIIAHPSYEIHQDFMSLGFRETVVSDGVPVDRNFYLIAKDGSFYFHEGGVYKQGDLKIIFDERSRMLIDHKDRWNRKKIEEFVAAPIAPVNVYEMVKQTLKKYVELAKEASYGLLAAWIIATYFYQVFYSFPYLFLYGQKQSGKSRVLSILALLCFNAMKVKGVSLPSLVDSVDGVRGTFLNDQSEALSSNVDLVGLIADAYVRGGGKRRIVDMSNKTRRIVEFEVFSPKAFASFKEIDPDLKDRCILVSMIRAEEEYPEPEPFLSVWAEIRDVLYRNLLTRWQEARDVYVYTGAGVSHRVRELWRPLETVLTMEKVDDTERQAVFNYFMGSMIESQTELSDNDNALFDALLELLKDSGGNGIFTSTDIAEKIKENKVKENKEVDVSEKSLTTWIGKSLSKFSLYDSHAGKKNKKRAYNFSYDHVEKIFNRYSKTSGLCGNVVNSKENQPSTDDHIKNACGTSGQACGIGGHTGGIYTTSVPHDTTSKKEVVNDKPAWNKAENHITTCTTSYQTENNNYVLETSAAVEL
ncbi:MAG: hypothetical protein HQK98_03535 [Nitrospirae bacterium]|nr:hypothetical protein [Nitrospirota bacterium]